MARPGAAQNCESGHTVGSKLPGAHSVPAGHWFCVAVLEPVEQKYPPAHWPETSDRPVVAQYEPRVHTTCMLMPGSAQKDDTGHTVAAALAVGQYADGWHCICVVAFEPNGQ